MQRLTRYPLLLRQVLHYSDDAEDTKDVQTALASAESVVLDVNEAVRRAENMERLRVLSEDLWIGGEGLVRRCSHLNRMDLLISLLLRGFE